MLAVVFCLSPLITPPAALLMGLAIAQLIGHPYLRLNHKATHILLQVSIVGLGFGMNVSGAVNAGRQGFVFTIFTIIATLIAGVIVGRLCRVEKKTSFLISAGTAICGGSAIAAIAPAIKAEEKQISVALGTIFILNAIALFVFPVIGHALNLSQTQFGLWCAVAIHDTSSVTGAAGKYGTQALQVATTVKLARALWIIPLALASSFLFKNKQAKLKIRWFIGAFIAAVVINTYIPFLRAVNTGVVYTAKAGLTLTLFLIGCGMSTKALQATGIKPFIQGAAIWVFIAAASLWAIVELAA